MKNGYVLTSAPDLNWVEERIGKAPILKVVTEWGLPGPKPVWTDDAIARACAMSEETVCRSLAGDGRTYPHAEEVVEEFRRWYKVRRGRMIFEIGNEPPLSDVFGYLWHLENALKECRKAFPKARFISTAMHPDLVNQWANYNRFIQVVKQFDYIGVHQYAHYSLLADDTHHGRLNNIAYASIGGMPWALTEFGVHDPTTPDSVKLAQYDVFMANLASKYELATIYHLCSNPINEDQKAYAI